RAGRPHSPNITSHVPSRRRSPKRFGRHWNRAPAPKHRQPKEGPLARSRSGTRGRRGPRKPPRRDNAFATASVQVADPRERGAIELPSTITVKELAELLAVNPADVIRELIKSGIFATINQLIDRDTASLVAGELGYEIAEPVAASAAAASGDGMGEAAPDEAT